MKSGDMGFSKFIVAGAFNTGLTYLMYLGLLYFLPYIWAYSLTYVCGIILGYVLNAFWVFRKKPELKTMLAYPLTYAINYVLGVALLWLLVARVGVPKEIGPLIVVLISVPVMYLFTRAIFRGTNNS